MGNPVQSWEMLAGLVVVMLVSGWSEGIIMNKCELKSWLENASVFGNDIANMVCTVKYISFYNTNLQTVINRFKFGLNDGLPDSTRSYNQPTAVIGDNFLEEGFPGERGMTENPVNPTDVVADDDLLLDKAFPTEVIAEPGLPDEGLPVISDQPDDDSQSGGEDLVDEPSEKDSESQSEEKGKVNSGDEPQEGTHESSEEGSAQSSTGEVLESAIEELTNSPVFIDDTFNFESASGEGPEPPTNIPQQDHTDNDIYEDGTNEEPVGGTRFTGGIWRALFQGLKTTDFPSQDSTDNNFNSDVTNNGKHFPDMYWEWLYRGEPSSYYNHNNDENIHYDSFESLYGYKNSEDSTHMPVKREDNAKNEMTNPGNQPLNSILYGIFQLSSMVCQTQWGEPSPNICNMDCEALTNDDITDDIDCLMTLKQQGMEMMIVRNCQSVEPSEFFADCD